MKYGLLCLIALIGLNVSVNAQFDGFPPFLSYSKNPSDFIPHDWILIAECNEDLNNDGYSDVVLAVQSPDIRIDRIGREEYPKMLIIALFDIEESCYMVAGYSIDILNPPNQQMTFNRFKSLSCDKEGNLMIILDYIWSGGTYHTNETTYVFRYMDKKFCLTQIESHRIGHHTNNESREMADFLKGRYNFTMIKKEFGKERVIRKSYRIEKEVKTFSDVILVPGVGMNAKRKKKMIKREIKNDSWSIN